MIALHQQRRKETTDPAKPTLHPDDRPTLKRRLAGEVL
jgi:hypothetical protein